MQRFGMQELRQRALGALEEALDKARKAPVERTVALRFALAFLSNFTDDRWPFDCFWKALAVKHDQGRWQSANAALNAIRLAVGEGTKRVT